MKNNTIKTTTSKNKETFTMTPLIEQLEDEIRREEVFIDIYREYLELAKSAEERFPEDPKFRRHTVAIQAILMKEYAELGKLTTAKKFLISIQDN